MNKNKEIIAIYEKRFSSSLHEQFFRNSGFSNYGYWSETTENAVDACNRLVDKLLEFIPVKKGNILDVACGQGGTTARLKHYFNPKHIVAINISENQIVKARSNAGKCSFSVMDAARLGFNDSVFNQVICVEAAFHFDTRENFFQESLRVLQPGGYLILTDILIRRLPFIGCREIPGPNRMANDWSVYKEILLCTGFEDVVFMEAIDHTWKPFRRNCAQFAADRLLDKKVGFRRNVLQILEFIFGVCQGWLLENIYFKSYPLIVAKKPDNVC